MARTSRFVRLTPYCVVEYMFEALASLDFYTDDFVLIQNDHLDIHQIANKDASFSTTKNILDLTAVPISANQYVYLDSEKLPNYLDYDSKFTKTDVLGYNVLMDKVRYHFVTGFDFDKFKGLLLSVKHLENNGKTNLFSNILLAPETSAELITFNPKPLFLGSALYDRYIDVLVPSIKNINEEYKTALVPASTFAAAITPNAIGQNAFIYNNQILVGLAECEVKKTLSTNIQQTYNIFEVSEFYEAPLSQSNEFDTAGAYINESVDGDYIEFYLTYNSGFPSDLIAILNARKPSDNWIVIHQLSVFEQVGSAFLNTSRFVFFQEDKFDEPNIFRPVLKNANEAVSMSIDYIARLTNQQTGEQIIREASFILLSPKKYGKKLIKIPLLNAPQSQRIYNKIIKTNLSADPLFVDPPPVTGFTVGSISPVVASTVNTIEYLPIFINNNNISISSLGAIAKINDSLEEVIFGSGKLRFVLSPFDNIIKLKVYTASSSSSTTSQVPLDLNISSAKYRLVFESDQGKTSIDNSGDPRLENLSTGVIVFKVSKKDSTKILETTRSRSVYLVSVAQDGTETLIYSGEWRKVSEQDQVDAAIATAREESKVLSNVQSSLNEISQKLDESTIKKDTVKLQELGSTQGVGISPVANRFGVKSSRSIKTNSKNAGKVGANDTTNTTGKIGANNTTNTTGKIGANNTNTTGKLGDV